MIDKNFGRIPDLVYIFSLQTNPERSRDILTAGHTKFLNYHREENKSPLACGERHGR